MLGTGTPDKAPRDADLACAILKELSLTASRVVEIVGQGEVNHVFTASTLEGELVIRFSRDPLDTDDYSKEAWCLTTMNVRGIPVPELIAVGTHAEIPYIVQRFVDGVNADTCRNKDLWIQLGSYSRTINNTPLGDDAPDSLFQRFGRDLLANWKEHIRYNLNQLTADDPLILLGAYTPDEQEWLSHTIAHLEIQVKAFGLSHGDLVPKNVLISADGTPVVIDWGAASAGPIPYRDYMRIWRDDAEEGFTAQDLERFAEGYGVPVGELLETMHALLVLDSIDVVRWALDKRPDRVESYVVRARQRLGSASKRSFS